MKRILLCAAGLMVCSALRAALPNVIVILSDDQGWGDFSLHGNQGLETPNLDDLARSGAQFDRFFVCSVCAPTRAEFLTGRHYVKTGVHGVSRGAERINADETLISELFKKAGYSTAVFGKWHSGSAYPYHPNARGFDEFYGFTSGHWAWDTTIPGAASTPTFSLPIRSWWTYRDTTSAPSDFRTKSGTTTWPC